MFRQLARVLTITVGLLLLWQIIVMVGHFPSYILPTPVAVFQMFKTNWSLIVVQAQPTIAETLIGLLVGTLIGSSSALVLALFKPARLWVMPILVLSQAIPTFAIAPLLIVWL
ncbi:MAG: ABC transporter permease, partial [Gammaproteobacteria bacterium]|nr:ABC transporter permease [Gammaproteobacteria bacterium]